MIVQQEQAELFVPTLAALHCDCFPVAERWDEHAMRTLLAMPGCFGWLHGSEAEGDPIGLALARVTADEAELLTLGVLPQARGHGHGMQIVQAVAAHAASAGAERLFLEASTENHPAIALYRRVGFAQVGVRKRYYSNGDDASVLAAALPLRVSAE